MKGTISLFDAKANTSRGKPDAHEDHHALLWAWSFAGNLAVSPETRLF